MSRVVDSSVTRYNTQVIILNYARENPKSLILGLFGASIALKAADYLVDLTWNFVSPYVEAIANSASESIKSLKKSFSETQAGEWFTKNIYNLTSEEIASNPEVEKSPRVIRELVTRTLTKQRPPTLKEITESTISCTFLNPLGGLSCLGNALQPKVERTVDVQIVEYVRD